MNTSVNRLLFRQIGLSDEEIEIYLYLTQTGVQTVKQISTGTKINRSTAYRYLEALAKKDLVEWVIGKRGQMVRTTSPENLDHYVNTQMSNLISLKQSLPPLIKQLETIHPLQKFATQVRYFEGEDGIKQMIWNTLKTTEPLRSYTPLGRREVIDQKFEDEFELEWSRRGLSDRIITNEQRISYISARMVQDYQKSLEIRIIPSSRFYITNDIAIYNNVVAIASLEKGNLVGVELENEEMAKTQKSIFEIVWDVGEELREGAQ